MSLMLRIMKWQGRLTLPFSCQTFQLVWTRHAFTRTSGPGHRIIPMFSPRGEEMMKLRTFQTVSSAGFRLSLAHRGITQEKKGRRLFLFFVCLLVTQIMIGGCNGFNGGFQAKPTFEEANDLFSQGNYQASLNKYEQIIETNPATRDRVLFEMGIIHAYPKNAQKDYQKSLECFQKLIREFPESGYRQNSEAMIFNINNVKIKDGTIAAQQTLIGALRQEVKNRENENIALQQKIADYKQMALDFAIKKRSVDKILIEKYERRLMLLSNNEVLKAYRIALGGNPGGPKIRQGDNKTPEGIYFIDSKNRNSNYHLSLHISYPNERDKKRAKILGAPPGGNIMIHGLKKDFSWVGDFQADIDWTKGCIAVTDEEIEEIYKLAPVGTVVEIRP